LFSALDALLDVTMDEALAMVPVNKEVKEALTERRGIIGMVLKCVLAYERGDWEQVTCHTLDAETIRSAYLQAINWAAESSSHGGIKKENEAATALL
jgi:EAL and modified HD-GYP domain-containing signal transduction protein